MASPRDEPFVWVTWLSGLLSGATTCEWAAWFKAHHFYEKRPREGDLAMYQIQHTTLLMQVRDKLRDEGNFIQMERQNEFRLRGSVGVLAGRPDLIAMNEREAWVIDVKTKSMTATHRAQVLLYMWALPKALPQYRGVRFDGRLICPAGELHIPAAEVDAPFVRRVREVLHRVCGSDPPPAAPSFGGCRYCEITEKDCPVRVNDTRTQEGSTDEF
jgi:CRISPR/Cas system-associated exonuclease Cas4 (RecB family)